MLKSLLLTPVILAFSLSTTMADWPRFLGPDGTSVSAETGLLKTWPAGGPKVLWTIPVGMGFGGASILGNEVFILDRIKDAQDVVRCFDLSTGKELWSYAYNAPGKTGFNGSRSVPAVDEEYVFTVGCFGHITCTDRKTHKPVWTKNLTADFDSKAPGWGVGQSPLLYKDMVIVTPLGKDVGMVAFAKSTGKIVWKTGPFGKLVYASPMLITLDGVPQIVTISSDCVASVSPSDGKILWSYTGWKCRCAIPNVTPIGDDRLFITGGYRAGSAMIKVTRQGDQFTASELFKVPSIGAQIHNAIFVDNCLYLNGNANETNDGLVCLSLEGKVLWKTSRKPFFDKGGLLYADGLIYMLDGAKGDLYLIQPSREGFKSIASAKLLAGKDIWAPMALSDGKLIIRDQTQMKCLDIKAN